MALFSVVTPSYNCVTKIEKTIMMPLDIGDHWTQQLLKLVRRGESDFEQHALGGVVFVPLVGRHGWREDDAHAGAHRP